MEEKTKKSVTKYGEFIPTFHQWTGLENQKKIVERLENITNKKEK